MHSSPAGRVLKCTGSSSALLARGPWDCVLVSEAIDLSSPAGTLASCFFPIMIATPMFINIIIIICYKSSRSRKK